MNQLDRLTWIRTQYICVLFLTCCFAGLIVDNLFLWIIILGFWLFIPALVVACISFFSSLRCNSRHKKILLILNIINILLLLFLFFNPARKCDADIMKKHYTEYGGEMKQIYRNLYDKMTPGCYVNIEFEHGDVSMFHFSDGSSDVKSNWDPSEEKIDSLLTQSGLDRKSLVWLEKELNKIGCISISMEAVPDKPFCIGFRHIGMGMYSYRFYNQPLSPAKQDSINADPSLIIYNDSTVFEYGGGTFGSQSFPGKQKYLEKQKKNEEQTKNEKQKKNETSR